ncbi:uncharacterized protein LOC107028017 [Solanum pennellii]|uniref:Uncharacterized protein LOC107028017 n=1 Tax=Solanum pennellii TaxID=28526 RepID=A0ABM1HEW2_SOLPN|nr:uncharacterized protein LOC107028017 [Solanum pennellii]
MNLAPISFNVSSSTVASFQIASSHSQSLPLRRSITPSAIGSRKVIPARDRVIDFGKYKGKMLGTLPSKYLKWVTKNLRARDFEEWAQLADQVLSDPIYKDRIEWEFAQNLLNGDVSPARTQSAVSELLEISTRFRWDNEDKLGWSKIDFELLGTSKGGRIPRLSDSPNNSIRVEDKKKGTNGVDGEKDNRERGRERIKLQRRQNESGQRSTSVTQRIANSDHFNPLKSDPIRSFDASNSGRTETPSRFPGRESLLKKALSLGTRKNTSN